MNVLTATVVARYRGERVITVTNPDGACTRVRWACDRDEPWRCDDHGPQTLAACPHTFSAGLLLAEELLGLTRASEYRPSLEGATA